MKFTLNSKKKGILFRKCDMKQGLCSIRQWKECVRKMKRTVFLFSWGSRKAERSEGSTLFLCSDNKTELSFLCWVCLSFILIFDTSRSESSVICLTIVLLSVPFWERPLLPVWKIRVYTWGFLGKLQLNKHLLQQYAAAVLFYSVVIFRIAISKKTCKFEK